MSAPKFTPGPWEPAVWYGGDSGGWAARGPHHEGALLPDYTREDDEPEGPVYQRAMADAHLIAAAPELYAACEALVLLVDESDQERPAFTAARAALRKARGES